MSFLPLEPGLAGERKALTGRNSSFKRTDESSMCRQSRGTGVYGQVFASCLMYIRNHVRPCAAYRSNDQCKKTYVCGNGLHEIDLGEGCDDGNLIDGDGCSSHT